MEQGSNEKQELIRRVQDLERERDELRKDIEQLCLHPSGPTFIGVATRMHLQRIAGLEQEIDNLKTKTAACKRECQNLREELSEAYRIKGQLADLYNEEASKNRETEKQIKFFQGCIAGAFAERDNAIMEMEKAKENEDSLTSKLKLLHYRLEELESASTELWKDNTASQIELLNCKEKMSSCVKVVSKFYEIRQREMGGFTHENLDEICSCLLTDPPEIWNFDEGRNSSTLKYIASLESKLDSFRRSMKNFQSKLQMGLEIEQHLKRRVQILEKQIKVSDDIISSGISGLRLFHNDLKIKIAGALKEENDQMELDFAEVKEKISRISEAAEQNAETCQKDLGIVEECKDLHVSGDNDSYYREDVKTCTLRTVFNTTSDTSEALALALKEKVDALLLLSQQEERHFLERETNSALQTKMDELQKNFFQVTHEKVKALMELAELKKQFQLQQEKCTCGTKHSYVSADGDSKLLPSQLRDGRLKGILKRTYLRRWIGQDEAQNESSLQPDPDVYVADKSKQNAYTGVSRSVESISGKETMNIIDEDARTEVQQIASSIHKLHLELLRIKEDVSCSTANARGAADALAAILLDANQARASLDRLLHVSSTDGTETEGADNSQKECVHISFGKQDAFPVVLEMIELLFLAAKLQEKLVEKIRGY